MPNDVVRFAMEQACRRFGGADRVFNAACFSNALMRIAGLRGNLDGSVVRVVLCGRDDVRVLGNAHFQMESES